VQLVDRRTYTQTHYPPGAPALFAVAYALGGRANTAQLDIPAAYPGLSRDAALSLEARRNVARYGRGRPAAFAGLLLSKLPRMWWVYSEGLRTREPAAAAALHRVLLVLSLLLLGAGLALTRHPALLAVTLVLAAISAQHMLLLALPRYAYPLLPVLYASAAAAAALLVERQRSER
jgi:hypothetical protein